MTARTIGRRNSPSSAIIALIWDTFLLVSFRVMVRFSVGCFSSQLLTMASLFAEPSGHYPAEHTKNAVQTHPLACACWDYRECGSWRARFTDDQLVMAPTVRKKELRKSDR